MTNTKIRPEIEIYDQYWKMTAGLTDIYGKEFTECLMIIVDYIDTNKSEIKRWNKKKRMKNSKAYFRGSKLYDNLVKKIISYMNYTSKSAGTSARKVINQYVKIGFIYPFLSGYSKWVPKFIDAITEQEKKVLFSKMFYDGASFSSATTVDNRSFGEVRFLLRTMEFNRYLTKEDIKALMGTDISLIKKGYLDREELKEKYKELDESGFITRKKIQFGHMTSYLNHFVDFKYLPKKKVFTFENDDEIQKILKDESIPDTYKRDAVKHRIYKEELKMESEKLYEKQICYAEKLAYNVLIASHIKECAKCLKEGSENQAYDVNNGLLLSPNIDSYFDKHDISFDDSGKILLGKRVDDEVKRHYSEFTLDEKILNEERKKYLRIHRKIYDEKQSV
ncbi:MAG: HNH endonuclease [Lachnospiraceae bacterium]|nr:HNH endonuclease [Lachnospiraceae bacterium]